MTLQFWTLRMIGEKLKCGCVPLPVATTIPATLPDHATILDFLEAAREGMPLGSMIWHEIEPDKYDIVDGIARVNTIARVLTPELYTDAAMRWPVLALPPDHPRAGRFAWGEQPDWGQDPTAFPLSAALKPMDFLAWENALRTRTPDDKRMNAALNAAYTISHHLLDAKITVHLIRRDVDGDLDGERLLEIRRRANNRFDNSRST